MFLASMELDEGCTHSKECGTCRVGHGNATFPCRRWVFRTESASFEKQLQRFLLVRNLTKAVRVGKNAERVELDRAMQLFLADAGCFE